MYLIKKKTGQLELMAGNDEEPPKAAKPPRSANSLSRRKPPPLPGEYSRTSDSKPRKTVAATPGEYSRTSERKRTQTPRPEPGARREKPAQSAKAYAVWLLSRQDYSAASLRRKLASKSYDESEIEDAMQFVVDNKYQNDERYAEQRSRGAENRAGNLRIEMTLRQKGIEAGLAKTQVQQLAPEEERVLHAVAKFREQVRRGGMTRELKVKIYRFLAYRGFSSKAIRTGIESLGVDRSWVEEPDS
ncbi:MAG: regulatory protein RecX [Noviherbaspirillum sp.]